MIYNIYKTLPNHYNNITLSLNQTLLGEGFKTFNFKIINTKIIRKNVYMDQT